MALFGKNWIEENDLYDSNMTFGKDSYNDNDNNYDKNMFMFGNTDEWSNPSDDYESGIKHFED